MTIVILPLSRERDRLIMSTMSYTVSDAGNWECKSSGRTNEARLDQDGTATIICKWNGTTLTKSDMYTKQVDLVLSYKYKEMIHKQIRINNE